MAEAIDLSSFVTARGNGCEMHLAVEGVHCAGCMAKIERSLKALPGVTGARLNFTNRRLTVDWHNGALEPGALVETLEKLGYRGGGRSEAGRVAAALSRGVRFRGDEHHAAVGLGLVR